MAKIKYCMCTYDDFSSLDSCFKKIALQEPDLY